MNVPYKVSTPNRYKVWNQNVNFISQKLKYSESRSHDLIGVGGQRRSMALCILSAITFNFFNEKKG